MYYLCSLRVAALRAETNVNWILLFKHKWVFKKYFQPLTLEWLDQRFPNFLSAIRI